MSGNMYFHSDIERVNKHYSVPDEQTIFRYMEFSKFMDLLENRYLFFCNSDHFEDGFEGEMPEGFYNSWPIDIRTRHKEMSDVFNGIFKTYVSCWNIGTVESYALWKVYTKPETGVAIKTNVKNLRKALNNDDIKIFRAEYIKSFDDISDDKEPPFYFRNTENEVPIHISRRVKEVYKLEAYRYENEMRAIFIDNSNEYGKKMNVNLHDLINEIYISPFASEWFFELVKKIIMDKKYNINDKPIHKSEIEIRRK